MRTESGRFEMPVVVLARDIDANGHASNVSYLRWILAAAVGHWEAAVPEEEARGLSWVVVRHEIDYKKPTFRDEELVVTTWVGAITAATTERFCEIRRTADGVVVAQGRTIWCAIDATSGRPKRVDATIRSRFLEG